MLARYVLADVLRNPRRTLATMAGVSLGVGLFCGVLFFVDGLSASMTQRAVAPLPIDMQRIATDRAANALVLEQRLSNDGSGGENGGGAEVLVTLDVHNRGEFNANDVTVRSVPDPGVRYVRGSAAIDGTSVSGLDDNPFAHGAGQVGYNLGTLAPGESRLLSYKVEAGVDAGIDDASFESSYSSRESVTPIAANQPPTVPLDEVARRIAELDGVAHANQLFIADLGYGTLHTGASVAPGPAKILGFDNDYASRDDAINILDGRLADDGAVLSAEAAQTLGLGIGDAIGVDLPDGSTLALDVSGIADMSRARSLFSSRRGGDLETFIYTRLSVVVSPRVFAETVYPAFEGAAADGSGRLKNPPIREIDVTLDHGLLDAAPAAAALQTQRLGAEINAIATQQAYLLDNISNTLSVAAADADVAKRLFVFLGVPGGLLAAALAAYAGNVLAEAQRREQATLRIRGASRRHLLRMLGVRTALLTIAGAVAGLAVGYGAAVAVLGRESMDRASTSSLVTSAVVGTAGGLIATGAALYITGRRTIDREINEDRAQLVVRPPLWRRTRADIVSLAIVLVGTGWALKSGAFEGTPGSVYFGRSVHLNLALLVLPIAVWVTGSLLAARVIAGGLASARPDSTASIGPVVSSLFRRSVGRRPWAIGSGAIVVSLIVALGTCLAAFSASYDIAKVEDARYANGADIRITPSPTAQRSYTSDDGSVFEVDGVDATTPVVYGLSNVILRSARTSDPANLAAIDPTTYFAVAPVGADTAHHLEVLATEPRALLLSRDMAEFLQADVGDPINVLLARATSDQVEIEMHIAGLYERLPGFPDGADAVMSIDEHELRVPNKAPDFYLAATADGGDPTLRRAVAALENGPAATDYLQIDTRATTLDRDQSSLAALNIAGLVELDSGFALAMATVTVSIFVFGLLLQRRREYVTLRAQGLEPNTIRVLITSEAVTVAIGGTVAGLAVGVAMGYYFVTVLRPLFVLTPSYTVPAAGLVAPVALVFSATLASSLLGSRLVNQLQPSELLRDE